MYIRTFFALFLLNHMLPSAYAALTPIEDPELSSISGSSGVGFILNDVQILGDNDTTVTIDNDLPSSDVFLDHLRLYNYDSADEGATISSSNGISWGTVSDPFTLNILSKELPRKNGLAGTENITYVDFALPSSSITVTNQALSSTFVGDPSTGTRNIQKVSPYECTGTIDCGTLSFRSRMDVYKETVISATTSTLDLIDRSIQWWEIAGLNLHGTNFQLWADPDDGIGISARVMAHADTIRSTRATSTNTLNYTDNPGDKTYSRVINGRTYNYNIYGAGSASLTPLHNTNSTDAINKTAPFSTDDTPNYDSAASVLTISDLNIELYLGQTGYQPVTIKPVFRATSRAAPTGATINKDDGVLDLAINIEKIKLGNSEAFYNQPRSNISIGNIKLAADGAGNCINPSHNICNFGSSSIEGIQIQHLNFRTQDLPALTASHCPAGWSCSFN